jgi:thiol-disulfide isomerase/thioredoxin
MINLKKSCNLSFIRWLTRLKRAKYVYIWIKLTSPMRKLILLSICLIAAVVTLKAQTVARDWKRTDCSGNKQHLFADLDSGKGVILGFYMPNCAPCPTAAQGIEKMALGLAKDYPGKIKGYAMPFEDYSSCSDVKTWMHFSILSMYVPLDSGAKDVDYYGGFGMPTVVFNCGADNRVFF